MAAPFLRTFSIGRFAFATKKEAESRIREILSRHRNGGTLRGADLDLVREILAQHPNRAVIDDCGIKRIFVQWLDPAGVQRRFVAVRSDDSIRDFTWRHALHERTLIEHVRKVCRSLVKDQIEEFKSSAFAKDIALQCPVSGLRITAECCDVDHQAPDTFVRLVDAWLFSVQLGADDVAIVPSPQYQMPDRFQDWVLGQTWIDFHRINAKLRVVHPHANRSLLRRKGNNAWSAEASERRP